MKVMEVIFESIYHQFPDRPDRRASIGDNCPRSGSCSGHPLGTHSNCLTLDMNYFTHGPNNTTQYRPGTKDDPIHNVTRVWDGNHNLKKDVFDWERNYILFKRILEVMGNSAGKQIIINSVMKYYIYTEVMIKYGYGLAQDFNTNVGGDSSWNLNHQTHAHINLGNNLNWNINIDW